MDFEEYIDLLGYWARQQEPVFIVGPERSGTSLLFQQVSSHPAFCDFKFATVETFCFLRPWSLLEKGCPANNEMRTYLGLHGKFAQFHQLVKPLIDLNLQLDAGSIPRPYLNEGEREHIWNKRRYRDLMRVFFHRSWRHLGQRRIVEKTPAHIRCVEEILDTFPKAKFLICTRSLDEIICSHKKRFANEVSLGKSPDAPGLAWLNKSTDEYINYLTGIDRRITHIQQKTEQTLVVPYGELTKRPTKTLASIFEFIGEPFDGDSFEATNKPEQAWDPLLNQRPQRNHVDVSQFLTTAEQSRIEQASSQLVNAWY